LTGSAEAQFGEKQNDGFLKMLMYPFKRDVSPRKLTDRGNMGKYLHMGLSENRVYSQL
jgi:hypothetical protein